MVPERPVSAFTRMVRGFSVLGLVVAVGVVGYLLWGWSLLDAFYMVVITIFGVGYGEVRNLDSPELKVFTMLLIISGCSALIYILGGFFQLIAEGELNRALGKRRMTKQISSLAGHVIVCGYGRIGRVLAEALAESGVDVVVVDSSEERCQSAVTGGYLAHQGDASHDATLLEVGLGQAKALCTVLPNDAMNVFITLSARNLDAQVTIIARGEDPQTEAKLLQAGANQVVLPSSISAMRMADMVTREQALVYMENRELTGLESDFASLGLRLVSLVADGSAEGHTIGDIERDAEVSLMVIGLKQGDEVLDRPPLATPLRKGDTVMLLAHSDEAVDLRLRFNGPQRPLRYRGGIVPRS